MLSIAAGPCLVTGELALFWAQPSVPAKASLAPGVPSAEVVISLDAGAPAHVGLVAYLAGDVDGSFVSPSGSLSLNDWQPHYLSDLAAAAGLNLTQFGVYG
jgi:hypothetical protein